MYIQAVVSFMIKIRFAMNTRLDYLDMRTIDRSNNARNAALHLKCLHDLRSFLWIWKPNISIEHMQDDIPRDVLYALGDRRDPKAEQIG